MESKDEEQPGERGEQRRHRRSLATALARRRRIGSWRQRSGGPRPPRGSRAFGAGWGLRRTCADDWRRPHHCGRRAVVPGVAHNASNLRSRNRCVPVLPDGSRARPSRRRAFSSAVRGCGRSRGRLRDRQLRVCALGREGGCSRARTGDGVLGQRHGLGDDVVSRHRTGVRRLLGRAQRGVDDPLNLRREVAWAQAARRLCGAGMQVRKEYERQDEDGDARGHVAARAAIGLATAVSPVIVQSVRPLRPTPPHDRFPHAVRSGLRPPPSHADESQTRRAPSSAIAVSVSGPAPPC